MTILRNSRDPSGDPRTRIRGKRLARDRYRPPLRHKASREQSGERLLPIARHAGDRDDFPGGDGQLDIIEENAALRIGNGSLQGPAASAARTFLRA